MIAHSRDMQAHLLLKVSFTYLCNHMAAIYKTSYSDVVACT